MVINGTPTLSLYSLVEHTSPNNIFTGNRELLAQLSASIEKAVIDRHIKSPIFVGFQQLRYFGPVYERYKCVANTSKAVWVFGMPDAVYPDVENIHYIELGPEHPLKREWFVVINDRHYKRALIAEEVSPDGTPHENRAFDGVLTSDPIVVDLMYQHLLAVVETIAS